MTALRRYLVDIVKQALREYADEEAARAAEAFTALLRKAQERGYVEHREAVARRRPEEVS